MIVNGRFPFLHKEPEIRTGPPTINWPTANLDVYFSDNNYQTSKAGVSINSTTALKHAAYWRAINLLSSQIASFPLGLYHKINPTTTVEVFNHPAVALIKKPNDLQTSFIFKETMQANILTWGNAYAYIKRAGNGNPLQWIILDSSKITPKSDGEQIFYTTYKDSYDSYNILHIPGISFNGIEGKAPIQAAAESIGTGLAMQKYINDLYENGAMQTGVLTHPMTLSAKAREGLRNDFNKKMKDKKGGTMILDEGMKYQGISMPPEQTQLLQSRKFSVDDIARWFGIPPHLLFEESRSTFNNIAEQGISFVRYTLTQWVERWEAELNNKLLTEQEKPFYYFKFNMNSLMRGNAKDRFEAYRAGLDLGIYSINEVRALEDMNAINGGDEHLVQLNRTSIKNITDGNNKTN